MTEERRTQPDRRILPRPGGRRATDPPADWLSVTDYARVHGVSRRTVQKWLRANILLIYKVGTLIRIRNLPPNDSHHAAQTSAN